MQGSIVAFWSLPLLFGSTTIQSSICQVPTSPVITEPVASATVSSQTVIVTGTTTVDSSVMLTDNGQPSAIVTSDASGAFQVQITLATGRNQLTAQTSNPCGTSGVTPWNVTVVLPPEPPVPASGSAPAAPVFGAPPVPSAKSTTGAGRSEELLPSPTSPKLKVRIISPDNHAKTSQEATFVSGTTNLPAAERIVVNGQLAVRLDSSGETFGASVPLTVGANVIQVIASANAQSATDQVSVTRIVTLYATAWYDTAWGRIALLAPVLVLVTLIANFIWEIRRGRRK